MTALVVGVWCCIGAGVGWAAGLWGRDRARRRADEINHFWRYRND